MSRLGWADIGIATLNDMTANAEMIANLDTSVPLIADADTGYGGPVMVSRTVANYARAGVAALHIEDQVSVGPWLWLLISDFRIRFTKSGVAF
jgi:2-methylisocitrate lyase-like PEP mutase family enzyme